MGAKWKKYEIVTKNGIRRIYDGKKFRRLCTGGTAGQCSNMALDKNGFCRSHQPEQSPNVPPTVKPVGHFSRTCWMPSCGNKQTKSSETSDRDAIHFFAFPADPDNFLQWWKAGGDGAPRPRARDLVCDRHFRHQDIIKHSTKPQGGKAALSRWRLRPYSAPIEHHTQQNCSTTKDPIKRFTTYLELSYGIAQLKLPDNWCSYQKVDGAERSIIFAEKTNSLPEIHPKSVSFSAELKLSVWICSCFFPAPDPSLPALPAHFTAEELEFFLERISEMIICQRLSSGKPSGSCRLLISHRSKFCCSCRKMRKGREVKRLACKISSPKKYRPIKTMSKDQLHKRYSRMLDLLQTVRAKLTKTSKELATTQEEAQKQALECASLVEKARATHDSEWQTLVGSLDPATRSLLEHIRKQANRKRRGRRYERSMIESCLELQWYGPKGYRKLVDMWKLPLPCPTTLRKALATYTSEPGLSMETVTALKDRVKAMEIVENQWSLVFDEMSIKPHIGLNYTKQVADGFVDLAEYSHTATKEEMAMRAKHALVWILHNLRTSEVIPLCYYFTGHSVSQKTLREMILGIAGTVLQTGISIKLMVCDSSSINQATLKRLGIKVIHNANGWTIDCTLEILGHVVYVMFDIPHQLKSFRNIFVNHGKIKFCKVDGSSFGQYLRRNKKTKQMELRDRVASVGHIRSLIERDTEAGQHCIRVVPKLQISSHLYQNNWLKMRVNLAAQLFSAATVRGLLTYSIANSEAMGALLQFMDELFDLLNSSHYKDKASRRPVECENKDAAIETSVVLLKLRDKLEYLQTWKTAVPQKERVPDKHLYRWMISIESAIQLSAVLLGSEGFNFVLTRKFTQDVLELIFGIIRAKFGCNDHPTAAAFRYEWRRLLRHYNFRSLTKRGNSELSPQLEPPVIIPVAEEAQSVSPGHSNKLEHFIRSPVYVCDRITLPAHQQGLSYKLAGLAVRRLLKPTFFRDAPLQCIRNLCLLDRTENKPAAAALLETYDPACRMVYVRPHVGNYFMHVEQALQLVVNTLPIDPCERLVRLRGAIAAVVRCKGIKEAVDLVVAQCTELLPNPCMLPTVQMSLYEAFRNFTWRYLSIRHKFYVDQMAAQMETPRENTRKSKTSVRYNTS